MDFLIPHAVADPGLSPGGAPTPKSAIIFQFFGKKLHENERIWTRGAAPPWIRKCHVMHFRDMVRIKQA